MAVLNNFYDKGPVDAKTEIVLGPWSDSSYPGLPGEGKVQTGVCRRKPVARREGDCWYWFDGFKWEAIEVLT